MFPNAYVEVGHLHLQVEIILDSGRYAALVVLICLHFDGRIIGVINDATKRV